jgi:hypothetical protein
MFKRYVPGDTGAYVKVDLLKVIYIRSLMEEIERILWDG